MCGIFSTKNLLFTLNKFHCRRTHDVACWFQLPGPPPLLLLLEMIPSSFHRLSRSISSKDIEFNHLVFTVIKTYCSATKFLLLLSVVFHPPASFLSALLIPLVHLPWNVFSEAPREGIWFRFPSCRGKDLSWVFIKQVVASPSFKVSYLNKPTPF